MNNEKALREQLLSLLAGGNAHMTFQEAIKDFPTSRINDKFPNGSYSAWGLLEHIRLTQQDILDFMVNQDYKEKKWPTDYWPSEKTVAAAKDWKKTIQSFEEDLMTLKKIVSDPKTDLFVKIPQGDGQTILREILLVADHNSYHIGEFAIMRQVVKTWGKTHA